MGDLPFEVWLFIRRLIRWPQSLYRFWKLPRFKEGDIYLDCFWHPVAVTEVTLTYWSLLGPYDWDLAGISLLDGTSPRGCSVRICGLQKLSYPVAEHIVSLMLGGDHSLEAALQRREAGVQNIQSIYEVSPELKQLWG